MKGQKCRSRHDNENTKCFVQKMGKKISMVCMKTLETIALIVSPTKAAKKAKCKPQKILARATHITWWYPTSIRHPPLHNRYEKSPALVICILHRQRKAKESNVRNRGKS